MSDWSAVRHILAVRLDSMGDVLMTTPAFRALRSGPAVERLTLLTSPAGAAIAAMVPEVDEVIVYEAPWMKAGAERGVDYDQALVERLQAARFDAAAIFTVYSQNPWGAALLCRMAGIPLTLAHSRERAYRLLSNEVAETEPEQGIRHEVRRHLDLVATLGWTVADERMSVQPPTEAVRRVNERLGRLDLPGRWAVLHPGSTAESRRYPFFAEVMRRLAGQGWGFVVTGDASERALCAEIVAESGTDAVDLSGQLDLGEMVALVARAPMLLTNNTGPAHIAAACGTPVVDLYALTNPQHTPWAVPSRVLNHDVPCRWCYRSVCPEGHHLCLRGVAPEQVVAAALALAEEGSGTPDQVRCDATGDMFSPKPVTPAAGPEFRFLSV